MSESDGHHAGLPARDSMQDMTFEDKVKVRLAGEVEIPLIKGDPSLLPVDVQAFIAANVRLCGPKGVYLCDGSEEEAEEITDKMVDRGMLIKLDKYDNWWV